MVGLPIGFVPLSNSSSRNKYSRTGSRYSSASDMSSKRDKRRSLVLHDVITNSSTLGFKRMFTELSIASLVATSNLFVLAQRIAMA